MFKYRIVKQMSIYVVVITKSPVKKKKKKFTRVFSLSQYHICITILVEKKATQALKLQHCTSCATDTQMRDWKENVSIFILMEACEDDYSFYLYTSYIWQQSCFTSVIGKKNYICYFYCFETSRNIFSFSVLAQRAT